MIIALEPIFAAILLPAGVLLAIATLLFLMMIHIFFIIMISRMKAFITHSLIMYSRLTAMLPDSTKNTLLNMAIKY